MRMKWTRNIQKVNGRDHSGRYPTVRTIPVLITSDQRSTGLVNDTTNSFPLRVYDRYLPWSSRRPQKWRRRKKKRRSSAASMGIAGASAPESSSSANTPTSTSSDPSTPMPSPTAPSPSAAPMASSNPSSQVRTPTRKTLTGWSFLGVEFWEFRSLSV